MSYQYWFWRCSLFINTEPIKVTMFFVYRVYLLFVNKHTAYHNGGSCKHLLDAVKAAAPRCMTSPPGVLRHHLAGTLI